MPGEAQSRASRRQPGLLLHSGVTRTPAPAQLDYFSTILHYGTKVAGLQILPSAWVPPYVAVPAWVSEEWANRPGGWIERLRRNQLDLETALNLASENGRYATIVRSSAVGESLEDRGLYKSLHLDAGATLTQLTAAIEEVFRHFAKQARHPAMGVCIQRYITPEYAGHVSNEVHLSATRNQWKYAIELPAFAPERGLNSKFAQAPAESLALPLTAQREIGTILRRVCHWVNERIDGRSHLEWCTANRQLWIVQLDQEGPTSAGVNPHIVPAARKAHYSSAATAPDELFTLYRIQEDPPWRKLRNLRDFWTGAEPPRHRLYYAVGDSLMEAIAREGGATMLATEIDRLTGGRAVLRTDCKDPTISAFNLPRTNTVDGTAAVDWIASTVSELGAKGAAAADIAIILHRYIPARAAAWTYFSPGEEIVRVDCLWGLPDGLQFLSHDSFEIDARTGEELAASVRYKPDFLQEQDDGTWRYVQVARQYGRDRVLSRDALRSIALETVAIASKINTRAQVMWFCDLPSELGLGQNLPWYRSKDFAGFAAAKRPPLPTRRIRNLADLEAIEQNDVRCIVLVAPEVELVRDDDRFLDRVIALAQARSLPIELAGSVLGHAYYRLRAAGILVLVPQPKYARARGRHRHYKVVRDAIPHNIAAKGERVTFARLPSDEAAVALIGKLFEEGLELNAAIDSAQKLEELADVLEVVRGLAVTGGIEWDDLVAAAADKREKRGGFEQQTVLLETARPMPTRVEEDKQAINSNEPSVQLRELGMVTVEGAAASISFSKLLSGNAIEVELTIGGRSVNVTVALEGAGVRLLATEVEHREEEPDPQLHLFDDRGTA